jgi:hypothetical protein
MSILALGLTQPPIQRAGRAIAQAVSRWLPTAAARVRARVRKYWICGGQSVTGERFSANLHSTDCPTVTLTHHLGLVQYARSGRSTRDLVPPH